MDYVARNIFGTPGKCNDDSKSGIQSVLLREHKLFAWSLNVKSYMDFTGPIIFELVFFNRKSILLDIKKITIFKLLYKLHCSSNR